MASKTTQSIAVFCARTIPVAEGGDTLNQVKGSTDVSIRFTVTLEDGAPIASNFTDARLGYTPGEKQILPALEEALEGCVRGDTRQFILSPKHDPSLKLDASRLAHVLGHPGETLILDVEIT